MGGWSWTERYGLVNARTPAGAGIMARIRQALNRGTIWTVDYLLGPGSGLSRNGSGTPAGAITVNGAGQTGATLSTAGWPISVTGVVRAGDLIQIENRVYEVSEDADSNGTGICVIPIHPEIYNAPANGATVTISGVKFRACIINPPSFPMNTSPHYFSFDLTFNEIIP